MRFIFKGSEPKSLLQHRLASGATYGNIPGLLHDELSQQLAQEQGFICCYCMQRITPVSKKMKIEHWAPQSNPATKHLQLDWKNLLGACMGREGKPRPDQHCDTRKGDTPITVNPTDTSCERLVRFLADGSVDSDDPAVQYDLNETLNLNHAVLKNNRKATLAAFVDAMARKHVGSWSDAAIGKELEELKPQHAGDMLMEYCQVPIFWLKKRRGNLGKATP